MPTYIVTGADSGLGKELVRELKWKHRSDYEKVIPVGGPNSKLPLRVDFSSGGMSVENLVDHLKYEIVTGSEVRLVNCAGVNYIEWFPKADWTEWDRLMDVNARSFPVLVQKLLEELNGGTAVNIVSNASHMAMTNSVFYNASKGAAHIATLALARELGKTHDMTIFGISPNKMSGTQMSKYIDGRVTTLRGWSPEEAQRYQLAGLPAGVETPPDRVAEFIAFLLSDKERHRYLHGTIIPYGGPA